MRVVYDIATGETNTDADWRPEDTAAAAQPVPPFITARQARLWLLSRKIDPSYIEAVVAEHPEAQRLKIEWEYATAYYRHDPNLVAILKSALKMSEEDIDAAFREAAAL